jgi:hypothetical protein
MQPVQATSLRLEEELAMRRIRSSERHLPAESAQSKVKLKLQPIRNRWAATQEIFHLIRERLTLRQITNQNVSTRCASGSTKRPRTPRRRSRDVRRAGTNRIVASPRRASIPPECTARPRSPLV